MDAATWNLDPHEGREVEIDEPDEGRVMSPEELVYLVALAKADHAAEVYYAAKAKYRAREIGDVALLTARAAYMVSREEFDVAYARAEREGVEL